MLTTPAGVTTFGEWGHIGGAPESPDLMCTEVTGFFLLFSFLEHTHWVQKVLEAPVWNMKLYLIRFK